ncbi:MAG: non-hydrolyzing UDP-N-acetylglucosamine 2-epimerase [Gaiellaceae bacterium]
MTRLVCFVVGTRPNFVKVAPVVHALRSRLDIELLVVHTGQHYDDAMSGAFLRDLDLPPPDVHLGVGSGTHAAQAARALLGVERVLLERRPDLVVVPGDVNSTLAGALAAAKVPIPVAHLEAGLRSFDPAMPEEVNRKVADHLSTLLLTHSESANENLAAEGITDGVHFVGNTMIDTLLEHLERARELHLPAAMGLEHRHYALVTLHRPALVDVPARLAATVEAVSSLAQTLPVVFPLHPRTSERLEEIDLKERLVDAGVRIVRPLDYLSFLALQADAQFVVTDSGGVQEETSALAVPCFTLRDTTERPVTVELGTNTVLGIAPHRIAEIPALLPSSPKGSPIPLWDGRAGSRAAEVIAAFVGASPSMFLAS